MFDVPERFRHYAPVLQRIGATFRRSGADAVKFSCVFGDRHKHGDRNPSAYLMIGGKGQLLAGCHGCRAGWRQFVEWVGLPLAEWFPDKGLNGWQRCQKRRRPVGKILATYDYYSAEGKPLYQKVRLEPKRFLQRRPLPAAFRQREKIPGKDEAWVWGLEGGWYGRHTSDRGWHYRQQPDEKDQSRFEMPSCPKVLYRLPELVSADPRKPVLFVEGEKDADRLASLGFIATCGPGGASLWDHGWAAYFVDRRLTIIPDNDHQGYGHATLVAGAALRAGAAEVRLVEWSDADGLPPGGDISDLLPEAGGYERVVEVCKRCMVFKRS